MRAGVIELGSFVRPVCTCGWAGAFYSPAMDPMQALYAQADAAAHVAAHGAEIHR